MNFQLSVPWFSTLGYLVFAIGHKSLWLRRVSCVRSLQREALNDSDPLSLALSFLGPPLALSFNTIIAAS